MVDLLAALKSLAAQAIQLDYAVNAAFMVAALLATLLVSIVTKQLRAPVILITSALIVWGLTESIWVLVYYAFLTVIAIGFQRVSVLQSRLGRYMVVVAIAFFVLNLCAIKYYPDVFSSWSGIFDNSLPLLGILGISYATFKILDLVVETGRGRVKDASPLELAAFVWFFPTFAQGPIQRSVPFMRDLKAESRPLTNRLRLEDAYRLCWGILKIGLFSKLAWALCPLNPFVQEMILEGTEPWRALVSLYALYLYIYIEFSGISDIAIVVSRWMGFDIPENFDFPFLARTPQEFWARWHMSLTRWCQDHIFFNIYKVTMRRFRGYGEWLVMLAPVFVTFIIIGLWHGNTLAWFFYGLVHALGVYLTAVLKRPFGRLMDGLEKRSSVAQLVADNLGRVLTFNFVSLSLVCALPVPVMSAYLAQLLGVSI